MDDITTEATGHDLYIHDLRRYLRDAMTVAEGAVREAVRRLDELMSDQVFDVEYADGADGEDMRALLVDAERKIRASVALNPVPEADETPEQSAAIVDGNLRAMGSEGLNAPEAVLDPTREATS